jgi:hypothetical protein
MAFDVGAPLGSANAPLRRNTAMNIASIAGTPSGTMPNWPTLRATSGIQGGLNGVLRQAHAPQKMPKL